MSFQPKQKNNDLSLSQETQNSDSSSEFDQAANSKQLENILGRINAIMTDGASNGLGDQQHAHGDLSHSSNLQNDDVTGRGADLSASSAQNLGESIQQGEALGADLTQNSNGDKFQVSEPLDMLQPYSEVLNEVRDYFNERHSLDPNDRLTSSQKSQSISEEVLGTPSLQETFKKPKKVLLWGDEPLDPPAEDTKASKDSVLNQTDRNVKSNTSLSDLSPSDFGFGQTEGLASNVVGQGSEESLTGAELKTLDEPSQIFSPIKFENPFNRNRSSMDVLGPEDNSGHFKQLRHELVDRIAQLEQVIGHHFGDRKEIANEAAQAAMKLALNNLDDTALGRRLADVEAAFILYQKNQDQKNQETKATIEKLGQALMKMEAVSKVPVQSIEASNGHVAQKAKLAAGENAKATLSQDKETVASSVTETQSIHTKAPMAPKGKTSDEDGNFTGQYRVDEIQVPSDKREIKDRAEKADVSTSITDLQITEDDKPPLLSPEALKNFGDKASDQKTDNDDVDAIAKLRQAMSETAAERSFGKFEKDTQVPHMSSKMTVAPSEQNKSDSQKSSNAHMSAGDGIAAGDDFLAKSASLRDQFNCADIVSNDQDLHTMNPKGLRIVIMVVVVALILAATGIAFRENTKAFQDSLINLIAMAKGVVGQNKSLTNGDEKTALEKAKADEDAEAAKSNGVEKTKSDDRLGSLNKTSSLLGKEPEVTGNIAVNGVKGPGEVADQPLLEGGVKLGMPPALIGPYSLRLAASRGDVLAEYEVARRFSYGLGVPKDPEQAVKWYMQGASKGFAPSQYRLATYYERGRGIEKNLGRAKVWYQRAAMLGNVKAMHNLAVISTALDKEDTDYKAAIYWFKQAANRNLADSQFNLAILYQNGVGLPKNNVQSYKWFSLAARQGDVDAAARRDLLEKKLKKEELLQASKLLQSWKALAIDPKANDVGRISSHITSTMSHADETVSRSRVLTAQILLRKLGYGLKYADGSLTEETIRAIKKFEKDKGLPITGKINPELIQILNKASL